MLAPCLLALLTSNLVDLVALPAFCGSFKDPRCDPHETALPDRVADDLIRPSRVVLFLRSDEAEDSERWQSLVVDAMLGR